MTGHQALAVDAVIKNSMITDGCRIDGEVEHSVLFAGVKVAAGSCCQRRSCHGGYRDQTGCSGRTLYYW